MASVKATVEHVDPASMVREMRRIGMGVWSSMDPGRWARTADSNARQARQAEGEALSMARFGEDPVDCWYAAGRSVPMWAGSAMAALVYLLTPTPQDPTDAGLGGSHG